MLKLSATMTCDFVFEQQSTAFKEFFQHNFAHTTFGQLVPGFLVTFEHEDRPSRPT